MCRGPRRRSCAANHRGTSYGFPWKRSTPTASRRWSSRAAGRSDPGDARADLDAALALWRGRAYAEFADEPWALGEAGRLEEMRVVAQERRCAAVLAAGTPADAVLAAEPLTREHPLREEPWRLRALALYAAGRQGEALAALRRARSWLIDELGVDPSPTLTRLEADILGQRLDPARAADLATWGRPPADQRNRAGRAVETAGGPAIDRSFVDRSFVDRPVQRRALERAAADVRRTATPSVCLLTGDPGAGKSTLLQEWGRDLTDRGWSVVTGRCPESPGGSPARAWTEIVRALAPKTGRPDVDPGDPLAPLLLDTPSPVPADPSFGRLMLLRAVRDLLGAATRRGPVAVVVDDLHRADSETLALLTGALDEAGRIPLLVVGAYRPGEEGEDLTDALAALAPHTSARVGVDGLDADQAMRLLAAVAGAEPEPATVTALLERTGGNAFFLTETARLLRGGGRAVALSAVPDGVRDVLRQRLRRLGSAAVEVLRLAAVVGRDVDVEVLIRAAAGTPGDRGLPEIAGEEAVVDALEAGVLAGLLVEPAPGAVRFAHVLARDTLYEDASVLRRSRWHSRVADAVAELRPHDVAAIADHRYRSGTAAGARAAVTAAVAAAEQAMSRYAPETAIVDYEQALRALDRLAARDGADAVAPERIELLGRLSRAQLAAGAGVDATATRTEAIRAAERSRDDALLVSALTSWDLPTPWTIRAYGDVDREVVALLERALALPDLSAATHCRLLCALVLEIAGPGQKQAHDAATQAEVLARGIGDPLLIGLAIHARAAVLLHNSDLVGRLPLARELQEIGRLPGLAVFALMGHVYTAQWAATHGEVAILAEHLEQLAALVRIYRWRQAEGVVAMHRGLLAHLRGDLPAAQRHYGAAVTVLRRNGGLDVDSIAAIAFFSVALTAGRPADLEPVVRSFDPIPEQGIDIYAIVLAAAGHPDEAAAARARNRPVAHDFFRSLLLTIRGIAVASLAVGDGAAAARARVEAERVYDELAAFHGQIGGAVTGAYALGPVDTVLGDLAVVLRRPRVAAAHFAAAEELADRCGSRPWASAARSRADRLRTGR